MSRSLVLKLMTLTLALFSNHAWGGETSVMDEDSIFRAFVKDTRSRVIDTIREFKVLAKGDPRLSFFCKETPTFTPEQLDFCRTFIKEVHNDFVNLVSAPDIVDFEIVDEDIKVLDPQGKEIAVDAKSSDHEPSTAIIFSYPRVQALSPRQMLRLWFHELGHKVQFQGQWVEDDKEIGPFKKGGDVLNAVARSLVDIAIAAEIVSDQFSFLDRFSCTYSMDSMDRADVLGFTGATKRYFMGRPNGGERYNHYQVAFTSKNSYWKLNFQHPTLQEKYFLSLQIFEDVGCDPDARSIRHAKLNLKDSDKHGLAAIVKSAHVNRNPICEAQWGHKSEPLVLEHRIVANGANVHLKFSCLYVGSFGLAGKPDL